MKKIILMVLLGCTASFGQWDAVSTRGYVSTGVSYQRWSNENNDAPIQQLVFPVSAFYPLRDGLYFSLSNTPGLARFDETTLSGLSDTWFRLTYVFFGDRLMLNLGVGMPTGKTRLDDEEFGLSQLLSENALRFRLPVYGQGLSAKAGIAAAYPAGDGVIIGVGANFVYRRFYYPLHDKSVEWEPGNEASVFVGCDARLSPSITWKGDFIYTLYGADRLNGERVFGTGDKMLASSTFMVRTVGGMIMASLRWRQKGKNEYWVRTQLEPEPLNSNGDQWELDGYWQFLENEDWAVRLLGEGRYYLKNEYDQRGALIYGAGVGATYRFSDRVSLRSFIKVLTGSLRSADAVGVTGLEAGGALVYGL